MPAGVNTIISHLDRVDSAITAAQRIKDWMVSKYDPSLHYPYNPSTVRHDIWKPGMSNYQYDIVEAKHYLTEALESDNFQSYLRYLSRK